MVNVSTIETLRPHLLPQRDPAERALRPDIHFCMDEREPAAPALEQAWGPELTQEAAEDFIPDVDWPGSIVGMAGDVLVGYTMLRGDLPKITLQDLSTVIAHRIAYGQAKDDMQKYGKAITLLLQHVDCLAVEKMHDAADGLQKANPAAIAKSTEVFGLEPLPEERITQGQLAFRALARSGQARHTPGRHNSAEQQQPITVELVGPHIARTIIIDHTTARFNRTSATEAGVSAYHIGLGSFDGLLGIFMDIMGVVDKRDQELFVEHIYTAAQMRIAQTAQGLPVPKGTSGGKLQIVVNK